MDNELTKAWKEFCNVLKIEKPTSYIYKLIICTLDWLNNKLKRRGKN